jgi:hypothetical protein
MAATNPGFQVVRDDTETEQPAAQPVAPAATPAQIIMLTIALKALSQRALTAATDLFTLLTCMGAWYLWFSIPDPNDKQIVSLSIYACFTLAANYIVRRK